MTDYDHLTDEQKHIIFEKGTEAPFSGKYVRFNERGKYVCAACGNKLFSSKKKYESDCGWPSFFDANKKSIKFKKDISHGLIRTEVICSKCEGHLGHVFDDGPNPTGKRYCINSLSLNFKKDK